MKCKWKLCQTAGRSRALQQTTACQANHAWHAVEELACWCTCQADVLVPKMCVAALPRAACRLTLLVSAGPELGALRFGD